VQCKLVATMKVKQALLEKLPQSGNDMYYFYRFLPREELGIFILIFLKTFKEMSVREPRFRSRHSQLPNYILHTLLLSEVFQTYWSSQ
jgi:hypothetical protein